jgi:hypothetical protein
VPAAFQLVCIVCMQQYAAALKWLACIGYEGSSIPETCC